MKSFVLLLVFIAACVASLDVTYERDMFVATYSHTTVYSTYVVGVNISTLAAQKAYHDITLSHDEDWSSFCLEVILSDPLPSYLQKILPSTFLDLRVFYRVEPIGNACPQFVMLCPDGTAVSATGPNCAVAPCPDDGVCIADVAVCADGTEVGRTGSSCEFNCPATVSTVSPKNHTEILAIQKAFWHRYSDEHPYNKYLVDVSPHTLASMNESHPIVLTNGETWDSYCLKIALSSFPQNESLFPEVYLGARLFYYTSNKIHTGHHNHSSVNLVFVPIAILLVVGCVGFCCVRRRKCAKNQQQAAGFQRVPVDEPAPLAVPIMMTPMMVPAEFDVEMMNGEQLPYEAMMIPVGYPHMYPQQPVWFVPPPQPQPQDQ